MLADAADEGALSGVTAAAPALSAAAEAPAVAPEVDSADVDELDAAEVFSSVDVSAFTWVGLGPGTSSPTSTNPCAAHCSAWAKAGRASRSEWPRRNGCSNERNTRALVYGSNRGPRALAAALIAPLVAADEADEEDEEAPDLAALATRAVARGVSTGDDGELMGGLDSTLVPLLETALGSRVSPATLAEIASLSLFFWSSELLLPLHSLACCCTVTIGVWPGTVASSRQTSL